MMKEPSETKGAHLHYVSDNEMGIQRVRVRGKFQYQRPGGQALKSEVEIARIARLAIPPAWTDVWICRDARGHIQATGRDSRGRKQYRYHASWRKARDENKFGRMLDFGRALPKIRRAVLSQLREPGLSRKKVLATIIRLLELSAARIGNERYTESNGSYGLTTLRNRHAEIHGATIRLHYRGKSGKDRDLEIEHPALARVVRKCQHLPGQALFEYEDEAGVHRVTSGDVNEYLEEISGDDFTAKDFRTWKGTLVAAQVLARAEPSRSRRGARKVVLAAIREVAGCLGNTPAVCEKSYIHPAIIESYMKGTLAQSGGLPAKESHDLRSTVFAILKKAASAARK
jgi:DNA topoisomerase-1